MKTKLILVNFAYMAFGFGFAMLMREYLFYTPPFISMIILIMIFSFFVIVVFSALEPLKQFISRNEKLPIEEYNQKKRDLLKMDIKIKEKNKI